MKFKYLKKFVIYYLVIIAFFIFMRIPGVAKTGTDKLVSGSMSYIELLGTPAWKDYEPSTDAQTHSILDFQILLTPTPTNDEQWMLELVNEARRDPGAFGYPSEIPVPPLYFEGRLLQVARDHTNNMLFGSSFAFFDHDSYTGCTAQGICISASNCHPPGTPSSCGSGNCAVTVCSFVELWSTRVGTAYSPYTSLGENISCNSSVPNMHQSWMNSSGHRQNIMSGAYREIGISFITGGPCGAMGTEDFGSRSGINPSGSGSVITGVVYEDFITPTTKYQGGEGIENAQVSLTGPSSITEFTWGSGGFNVFPDSLGTYTITVTAPGYLPNVKTGIEALAGITTKVDFIMIPVSTPTNTPSLSSTPTFTPTMVPATPTRTLTPTLTKTATGTSTFTFTPTMSFTSTPTATFTSTFTRTATSTPTLTITLTPTLFFPSATFTLSPTATHTSTFTSTPSWTATSSSTAAPTSTRTLAPTATYTLSYTATNTITIPTNTATRTPVISTPTNTPTIKIPVSGKMGRLILFLFIMICVCGFLHFRRKLEFY
ncbi:MAG: hypothetical protein A2161_05545 [Candidatus Schekmanbacteria bacterium RBG_13_48_7]|uniref:SCP domain-containing protein n=1 Tax=Candidatus Schekmanbacteria bacterium RBG_13_48_7 TaxID=1817878 RepID=A0A1F7S4L4_9BACT|nr:MAG: hypothetical protein A2161_05545 [Candidatus Schekmanbacteria bacterium RBG_13_48_7]